MLQLRAEPFLPFNISSASLHRSFPQHPSFPQRVLNFDVGIEAIALQNARKNILPEDDSPVVTHQVDLRPEVWEDGIFAKLF
jgi:hypothetical protein